MRPSCLSPAAAALAAALMIGACGSGSSHSPHAPGSGGLPTQAQVRQDVVRFAACMRSHGVQNWPDPTTGGVFDKRKLTPQQLGVGRSQVHAAATACGHLLPGGGSPSPQAAPTRAQAAALLAFARCLRTHGFPSFPDPSSSGQLTHEMLSRAGINLHQPAVGQAGDACTRVTHGLITRAAVARFIAGQ